MTKTEQHIIIVTSEFPPQPGGIGNHAYNLALYLSKAGYMVTVIADQRSESGNEEEEFDASLPFLVSRIKRYNWRFRMYVDRILKTFKNFKKDAVVIATGKFSLWNVASCSLFYRNKTLAVVHGSEVNFKSTLLKKSIDISLKRMDHIISVSNFTKNFISHLGREIHVIPNGIDITKWKMDDCDAIKIKGIPSLTTVGRVSSRKGQLNVIRHLPHLIKQFPKLHYHCIGIPTEAEAFANTARTLGVSEFITFHGSISDDNLKKHLNETDIFVMLSSETETGDVEGFGIAILEANSLGVPAIGSKGCGIEDAIDNHNSGILIDANDTEGFINAIEHILVEKERYKEASKSWAIQHSWNVIIERYINIIDAL